MMVFNYIIHSKSHVVFTLSKKDIGFLERQFFFQKFCPIFIP
jgi:hypothetical protein